MQDPPADARPIGVAMIGHGIFARDQHLPALRTSPSFALKAVFSRTRKSLASVPAGVDRYSDDSLDAQLDHLLARADIAAVVIALPIPVQVEYVVKAIRAGKHVLAEKPIAEDMNAAKQLLKWHRAHLARLRARARPGSSPVVPLFGVAENFRFQQATLAAAAEVTALGPVISFSVRAHNMVTPESVLFTGSAWRRNPTYQGGLLLESGVHHAAVLRRLLEPERLQAVSARVSQRQRHLTPIDTVEATVRSQSGAAGSFSLSVGSESSAREYDVTCERGRVQLAVRGRHMILTVDRDQDRDQTRDRESDRDKDKDRTKPKRGLIAGWGWSRSAHPPAAPPPPPAHPPVQQFPWESGVPNELEAFAAGIRSGKLDPRQSPYEALKDLELVEAMLVSGAERGVEIELSENLRDPAEDPTASPPSRPRGEGEPLSPHMWQLS